MARLRGAVPTPRNRLAAARPYVMGLIAAPAQWIWLPRTLSYWGNNVDGCCVTTEEAFAKACCGILISDPVCHNWASKHGVLNGAYLDEVIGWMQTDGFPQDGNVYNDGAKTSVDWTNPTALRDAISVGPVKIGVSANQLELAVGARNGWLGTGFQRDANLDHCVSLCGYGPIGWLGQILGASIPTNVRATDPGYACFTWNTVGILDVPSMLAITGEAWSRFPTNRTVGSNPPTPDVVFTPDVVPPPDPPDPPVPPRPPVPPTPSRLFRVTLPRSTRKGGTLTLTHLPVAVPAGTYDFVPVMQAPLGPTYEVEEVTEVAEEPLHAFGAVAVPESTHVEAEKVQRGGTIVRLLGQDKDGETVRAFEWIKPPVEG